MSRQELPLFTAVEFTFLVATTVDEADKFVQTLTASAAAPANVFGFDVELTPSRAVRLVQIASREQAYVFDISLIGSFPASLLNFVENRDYIKIGVDILGDARTLPGASMRSGGELSRLHRTIDHSGALLSLPFASSVALSTLSERWIGRSLDKSLQKVDWSQPLQTEHYTYAAAVAIRIYDSIARKCASIAAPNPFWVFIDIDPLSGKAVGLYDEHPAYAAQNVAPIKSIEGYLNRIKRAIKAADHTVKLDCGGVWSQVEAPATVDLCSQLSQALDNYYKSVASYSK